MAIISTWESGTLRVSADGHSIRIGVESVNHVIEPGYIRVSPEEAVKLRDELSRAITEMARTAALIVAATEEAGAAISKAATGETP